MQWALVVASGLASVTAVLIAYIRARPAILLARAELEFVRQGNRPTATKSLCVTCNVSAPDKGPSLLQFVRRSLGG